jgi:pyruvate dehydrogenase E1 component alpha subunit
LTGHSAHDGASYVPKEMFEEWGRLDPIVRLQDKLIANGWADRAELEAMRAGILEEIDDAVAWAERSPYPDPATLTEGVYENQ